MPTSNDKVSTEIAGTIIKANKEAEVNIDIPISFISKILSSLRLPN